MADGFAIRFWGVRGSIACPGPGTLRYGGNTACVEVRCGDRLIILDCGTGIRELGRSLAKGPPVRADILLSHFHLDHIVGLPFFAPCFTRETDLTLRAGRLNPREGVGEILGRMISPPLFPLAMDAAPATFRFVDFPVGAGFDLGGGIRVRTAPLDHPGGAVGYRIEHGGRAFCYVSDTGHVPGRPNADILGLIEGADLVVYDAAFTEEEFARRSGWGHSTWNEGISLCRAAGARRLALFHHEPGRDDDALDRIAAKAAAQFQGAFAAREGLTVEI